MKETSFLDYIERILISEIELFKEQFNNWKFTDPKKKKHLKVKRKKRLFTKK